MLRGAAQKEETTMRMTIVNAIVASLLAATSMQIAAASERHHAGKTDRAAADARFRNSNAALAITAARIPQEGPRYTGGISAPAGR
jgi:hypothetical protein